MTIVQWNLNKDLYIFEDKVYDLQKGVFSEPNTKDYMNLLCGKKYDIDILENSSYRNKKERNYRQGERRH